MRYFISMSMTSCVKALSLKMILSFAWSAVVASAPECREEALSLMQLDAYSEEKQLDYVEDSQESLSPRACNGVWSSTGYCKEKAQLHIVADRVHALLVPIGNEGSAAPILELPGRVWQFMHHHSKADDDVHGRIALGVIENEPSAASPPNAEGRTRIWIVALFVSLGLAALCLWWYASPLRELKSHGAQEDTELLGVQGRPCWTYCCALFCIKATCLVFWLAYALVSVENEEIRKNPHRNITSETDSRLQPGEVQTVLLRPIDPGRSAYLASLGIMLSLMVAFMIMANRIRGMAEIISNSLLIQFMLRGATFSILVAVSLEAIGQNFLNKRGLITQTAATHGRLFGIALMMLVVGFSEEFAKLMAATCGTSLSQTRVSREKAREGCCHKHFCHVWVSSPRALALAGLACGFGFMALENVEYILAVVMRAPSIPEGNKEDKDFEYTEGVAFAVTMIIIAVRVLLNLHPWLAGLSALRVGRVAFQSEPTTACLKTDVLIWACLPSALIHAAYDFVVQVWPFMAVVAAPCMWYFSRWLFLQSLQEESENVDKAKEGHNEDVPPESFGT